MYVRVANSKRANILQQCISEGDDQEQLPVGIGKGVDTQESCTWEGGMENSNRADLCHDKHAWHKLFDAGVYGAAGLIAS